MPDPNVKWLKLIALILAIGVSFQIGASVFGAKRTTDLENRVHLLEVQAEAQQEFDSELMKGLKDGDIQWKKP